MLHKFSIIFGLVCFFSSVHSEGRQPYDPSTVINVYPSLASLNNKGKPMDMDDDMDSDSSDGDDDCDYSKKGSCASASNVHSTWLKKIADKEPKEEPVATAPPKHDRKNKDAKKMKLNSKSKFSKSTTSTETNNLNSRPVPDTYKPNIPPSFKSDTPSKIMQLPEEEKNKVHNWSSLQDMLQLLKKRKH